jgi:hypothetical protein
MVPIQAILITLIVLIGGVYLITVSSRLVSRLVNLALIGLGVLFVVSPELTTRVAHSVGVGRGADLLLYLLCLVTVSLFLRLYRKNRTLEEKLTQVVRQVALLGASQPGDKS